jgi:hypothetical protein
MKTQFYVTMLDTFMSGWGMAKGKDNIMIVECDSLEDAELIAENAAKRSEMKSINIWTEMPEYDDALYVLSVKTFDQLSGPWKEVTA